MGGFDTDDEAHHHLVATSKQPLSLFDHTSEPNSNWQA
jgi:hypothetical protein